MLSADSSFPTRLDPDLAACALPETLTLPSGRGLVAEWCTLNGYNPLLAHAWVEALLEWKYAERPPKSTSELMVAAVEFDFPSFRGKLLFARARALSAGWVPTFLCPQASHSAWQIAHCTVGNLGGFNGVSKAGRRDDCGPTARPCEPIRIFSVDVVRASDPYP